MAMEKFRYTIHRVGVKKALKRGEIRKKKMVQAIKAIQRKIKKLVTKQHIPLFVKVWNAEDETEHFSKQYDTKADFRGLRKPAKWRQQLSRKAKYSRTFDPTPMHWFVAIGKRGQIDLTKLAYTPARQTLLKKKRKRLFGPFEDEMAATAFRDKIVARLDDRRKTTDFTQTRRYKGRMEGE